MHLFYFLSASKEFRSELADCNSNFSRKMMAKCHLDLQTQESPLTPTQRMWQKELRISLAFFHTQDLSMGINLLDKKGKLKGNRKLKISVHGCKTCVKYKICFFDTVFKIALLSSLHSFEGICLQQCPWENSNKHCMCQEGKKSHWSNMLGSSVLCIWNRNCISKTFHYIHTGNMKNTKKVALILAGIEVMFFAETEAVRHRTVHRGLEDLSVLQDSQN